MLCAGYDSVWARGRQEPDKSHDTTIQIAGKPVKVPQAKPTEILMLGGPGSSFDQSEYLVYDESQVRVVVSCSISERT